jgi:hypothetical protein
MRRRPGAAIRVYDEDEFFAAPVEKWSCDAAAPAARPRFRRLAGGTLLAATIVGVGGALVLERPPSPGHSRAGAMLGVDGSRAGYLAARPASVPIPVRSSGRAPQGSGRLLPARAPGARTGGLARAHLRAPRAHGVAVRARMTARARIVATPAAPAAPPAPAAAPVPAGEGLASVARGAEPAVEGGAPAEGRPVASASGGATGREHPEFGFER